MGKVSVRYIVANVDAAIPFYTELLGFQVDMHSAPGFASLSKGDLQMMLNQPGAGAAGQAMPDGQVPAPRRLESNSDRGYGFGRHRREDEACRMPIPQRDRDREGREANPRRRPVR
jgi:catechol 2,3-dioxygenase-like lactoylglutathione lyase family enzyme